jgi:Fur family ferric uptake transcriptional regulator
MERKRPANYRTWQGQRILDYMKSLGDAHVTINQMARHFEDAQECIGQTTIYRHLERLSAEGKIRKFVLRDDKTTCYQYIDERANCREHFHLKCEVCGGLFHVDCHLFNKVEKHLLRRHDFQINLFKTVFYGTCGKCLAAAGGG